MKVLIIVGSPHKKGESYRIEPELTGYLNDEGIETETVYLAESELKACIGCYNCFPRGEDKCPLKDDRAVIEKKMLEADGLVVITPVYSEQIPALLKNFIDRMSYVIHRPRFFGKSFLVIAQSAGSGLKQSGDYLKKILSYWGYERGSVISIPVPMRERSKRYETWRLSVIGKGIERLLRTLNKKKLKPNLMQVGTYGAWKRIAEITREINPFDYEHWSSHGWLEPHRNYFTGVRIGPLKWLVSRLAQAFTPRVLLKGKWKE